MKWNKHLELEGTHAYLSASTYHWLGYSEEKLINTYMNFRAKQKGTELHEIASKLIDNGIKLPKNNLTLNRYVNDGIGFKMRTEQLLYYSYNCYGTADAISFRKKELRIHDLKTGVTPAHMEQLMIYAALFCLEYGYDPHDLTFELRIYQLDNVIVHNPTGEDIMPIMIKIKESDRILKNIQESEE